MSLAVRAGERAAQWSGPRGGTVRAVGRSAAPRRAERVAADHGLSVPRRGLVRCACRHVRVPVPLPLVPRYPALRRDGHFARRRLRLPWPSLPVPAAVPD
jgi:hypothetical protein